MTLSPSTGGQSSIRSFFQPQQPTYASAPPSAPAGAATAPPPPSAPQAAAPPSPTPSQQLQQEHKQSIPSPPPPPPPAGAGAAANPHAAVPVPAPKPTHHPNVTISPILPSHIPALRRMTARILPVRYPDSFWEPLLDPESSGAFSRVLLWHDRADGGASSSPSPSSAAAAPTVIGGLVCRPEPVFQARPGEMADLVPDALYIQSLVLLEPYRRLGLAGAMLDDVCARAARDPRRACRTVCAHVWTPNQEGMDWYLARGFTRVEPVVTAYYRMLSPSDAWIVRRDIAGGAVLDALRAAPPPPLPSTTTTTTGPEPPRPTPTPVVASSTRAAPPPPPSPLPLSSSSSSGPPPGSAARPAPPRSPSASGTSFQNARPETEWNDLPADMARNLAVPGSGASSGASSRSSSAMRKKRDKRAYPAAAFGNPS